MPKFINQALAELVLGAATAIRDSYLALPDKGYQSFQPVYEYEENEAGWPSNTLSAVRASKDHAPFDWSGVVGTSRGKRTTYKFYISDVPALQKLIDFILNDKELISRISATSSYSKDEDSRNEMVAHDAVRLVRSVLNRAEAIGDTSVNKLKHVYSELEPGLLANELSGDLLFPITLRKLDIDSGFQVSDGIVIEPLSREVQLARAPSGGSSSEVNPFLVAAATHAIVLKNRKFENDQGPLMRLLRLHYDPPGTSEADLVCEALTISSGLDVGYAQVCLRPNGWADDRWRLALPAVLQVATVAKYPLRLNERGWLKAHDPITGEALEQLPAVFAALKSTDRRAQLASRRLTQTSRRDRRDDALIDACIGIEALLGEQHSELVHRMGLRAATALSAVGWDPATSYEVLKKVYEHRSKIVHGGEPKKETIVIKGKEYSAHSTAVYLLRELLNAHVLSNPPWSPDSLDKDLYSALGERQVASDARLKKPVVEES